MTTPQTQPTPGQWADTLEKLARDKALPSLWPEDCLAIAATLRAQAAALASREAECERLWAALEFYADEGNLDAAGYGRHMLSPQPGARTCEPDRGQTARAALTPTQEAQ